MFTIIVLVILFIGLKNNYKKDSNEHGKAKVLHTIILSILLINYSGSLKYLFWFLNDFNSAIEYISRDVGIFSGLIMQLVLILECLLSIYILFCSYRLINRKNEDLARLKFILPLIAVTESFTLYKLVVEKFNNEGGVSLFVICIMIYGSFAFVILKIYSKQFMIDFFNYKESKFTQVNDSEIDREQ